jgi:hypothetical protein
VRAERELRQRVDLQDRRGLERRLLHGDGLPHAGLDGRLQLGLGVLDGRRRQHVRGPLRGRRLDQRVPQRLHVQGGRRDQRRRLPRALTHAVIRTPRAYTSYHGVVSDDSQAETRAVQAGRLRELPAVHELAAVVDGGAPRWAAVEAARRIVAARREAIRAGGAAAPVEADEVRQLAAALAGPHLRRVVNATGVVLHTNLGRAPLAPAALAAVVESARGYTNLEYELAGGQRG